MKSRNTVITIVILATVWHNAVGEAKKRVQVDAPPPESVLRGSMSAPISSVIAFTPEMPLGPQDVLKSYEIAMSLIANKASNDFEIIVEAEQSRQITREQAEYLLQQRYQTAIMQYQVLSALHEVLKHDMDEATLRLKNSLKAASSDEILLVPMPTSPAASR